MDHAAIAARIPHSGSMCLLQRLESQDDRQIRCSASSHHDADNPLRVEGVLPAASGVEWRRHTRHPPFWRRHTSEVTNRPLRSEPRTVACMATRCITAAQSPLLSSVFSWTS